MWISLGFQMHRTNFWGPRVGGWDLDFIMISTVPHKFWAPVSAVGMWISIGFQLYRTNFVGQGSAFDGWISIEFQLYRIHFGGQGSAIGMWISLVFQLYRIFFYRISVVPHIFE